MTDVDLRHLPAGEIIAACERLVSTDRFVLHGSAAPVLLDTLHPRLANDASKASGNLLAVYATTDALQALFHATLNRPYLASVLRSFTIGYRRFGDSVRLRVSDNVYKMFKQGDPNVRTGGIVYVLSKAAMTRSPDAVHEYHSEAPVAPVVSLRVPLSVGERLIVFPSDGVVGTLATYTAQEQQWFAELARTTRPRSAE